MGYRPIPGTDTNAAPLLHAGDVLLGLFHLSIHLVHTRFYPIKLLWGMKMVQKSGSIIKEWKKKVKWKQIIPPCASSISSVLTPEAWLYKINERQNKNWVNENKSKMKTFTTLTFLERQGPWIPDQNKMAREEVSRSVENTSSNKPFIPGQNLHYRNYVYKYMYILVGKKG